MNSTIVDIVRQSARGREIEILERVANIPRNFLHTSEGPCPWCGGVTRFRVIDEQRGAVFCSHCFDQKNGDYFSAVQKGRGVEFLEAAKLIGEYLGVSPQKIEATNARGRKSKKASEPKPDPNESIKILEWNEMLAVSFCRHKKGVKPIALRRVGAVRCEHMGLICMAIPVWDAAAVEAVRADSSILTDPAKLAQRPKPCGWTIYNIGGGTLPKKGKNGEYEQVKVKLAYGSQPGIMADLTAITSPTCTNLWKLEGPSDLLAALSLPDVPTHVGFVSNANGAGEVPHQWMVDLFEGRAARVLHDADQPGVDGARDKWAPALTTVASEVRLLQLPYEIAPAHGKDLRDFVTEEPGGHVFADLAAIEERTPAFVVENGAKATIKVKGKKRRDDGRRWVELRDNERDTCDELIQALALPRVARDPCDYSKRTYQRGPILVQVVRHPKPPADSELEDNPLRILPLTESNLRERLTAAAVVFKPDPEAEFGSGPSDNEIRKLPHELVKICHQRGTWPADAVPPLAGIVTAPTPRPDGSIIQDAGYDEATGLIADLAPGWPKVPENPTQEDAKRAARDLLEVFQDFPFRDDSNRSACLAVPLTLLGRSAIDGPCPLFLFDANTRGSGKTKAANAAGIIATGRSLPSKTLPTDEAEFGKVITTAAIESEPVMFLDNVDSRATLGGPALDMALTTGRVKDRVFQSQRSIDLPLRAVWIATGNNVQPGDDTTRRILPIRLESPEENPEDREGFKHPDLLGWVRQERQRLAVAGLTILRAYVAAGKPKQGLKPWGSFEAWSDLIRESIVWAGLPDPAETRSLVRESDRSADLLQLILAAIEELGRDGATASEMVKLAEHSYHPDMVDPYPTLREMVSQVCGTKANAKTLGARLRTYIGRVSNGRKLATSKARGGIVQWKVERADGGFGGFGGFTSTSLSNACENRIVHNDEYSNTHIIPGWAETNPPNPPNPPSDCPKCGAVGSALPGRSGRRWCNQCSEEVTDPPPVGKVLPAPPPSK